MVEPLPAEKNTEVEFSDEASGANVPKNLVPALKKVTPCHSLRSALEVKEEEWV